MKKVSSVIEEKNVYKLEVLIRDTALMSSLTGKTGLINIKTNEIVGSFDIFFTIYNLEDNFYFQEKKVKEESKKYFKMKEYVRIYDALHEKMIADGWLVVRRLDTAYHLTVLQDPNTKKYHLFHESKYRTSLNIFEIECDDIQFLYEYYGDKYLLLTKDGKKAIYSTNKGLTILFDYDDIERMGEATVFTQGKLKFFTCLKDLDENGMKSPLFEEISCDKCNDGLLYCKRNNMIAIYYIEQWHCRLLFTAPVCDDIKCLNTNVGRESGAEYVFLVQKDNKYGLISGIVSKDEENEIPCQSLVNIEYDGIVYKNGDYFLNKEGKQGIFTKSSTSSNLINAEYDKVIPIYNSDFYELYNGESCKIVLLANNTQYPIIRDCKIIKNIGSAVIFEKNGFKGIFWALENNKHLILDTFDDVEYLGSSYYLITKNGKKGIIHDTEIIIEPKYESIEINGYREYENLNLLDYAKTLYFALKVADGQYELAKYKKGKYSRDQNELEYLNGQGFNDIKLYNHIMVFRNQNSTYVYSYDEKLLKTYPSTVEISTATITRGTEKINLYLVDGVYYIYQNHIDEEVAKVILKQFPDTP